jgi:hypothetical protein
VITQNGIDKGKNANTCLEVWSRLGVECDIRVVNPKVLFWKFGDIKDNTLANMDCLKGIARLQRQTVSEKILPQSREPARKLLELCYHRSRRAAVDFLAQSAGGEFGEVYRAMADREGKHCVWLAQLLGMQ